MWAERGAVATAVTVAIVATGVVDGVSLRRGHRRHGKHSAVHDLLLLHTLLNLLLSKLLLDVMTIRHTTLGIIAMFSMVATQSDELLADGTLRVVLATTILLAALRVLHHPLHLYAAEATTIGIAALARVQKTVDAPLNGLAPSDIWRRTRCGTLFAVGVHVRATS